MKSKLVTAAVILFFFGLPFFGTIFFWNDAHRKIRMRGLEYANAIESRVFTEWSWPFVLEELWPDSRPSYSSDQLAKWKEEFGTAGPIEWTAVRSYAREREDQVSQFVVVNADVKFSKKPAKVAMTISHVTTSSRWRIEQISVKPL